MVINGRDYCKAIEHILHNFPSLVAHLEHMAWLLVLATALKRSPEHDSERVVVLFSGSCYA